ncbi:MAG: GatB/YqeY domain-containing protein [Solirubrobacteraceae bacterium]
MTVAETVKSDLVVAMKAGERDRVGALRMILSELQKAAKEGGADEVAVLRRERKRRLEAERTYREAARPELAETERAEAELIDVYLPAELGDDELRDLVRRAIAESGASSPKDMGRVMPVAIAAVGGRADGRRVSAQVKEALAE